MYSNYPKLRGTSQGYKGLKRLELGYKGQWECWKVAEEKAGSERQKQRVGSPLTNPKTVFAGNPLSWA